MLICCDVKIVITRTVAGSGEMGIEKSNENEGNRGKSKLWLICFETCLREICVSYKTFVDHLRQVLYMM